MVIGRLLIAGFIEIFFIKIKWKVCFALLEQIKIVVSVNLYIYIVIKTVYISVTLKIRWKLTLYIIIIIIITTINTGNIIYLIDRM